MKYLLGNSVIMVFLFIGTSALIGQAVISFGPQFPVISDSLKYIEIAESIQRGTYASIEGIIYPPGYPTFLAFAFTFFGTHPETIYQLQFLLLGGISGLMYLIGRRHLGLRAPWASLSGLLVLVWPYMVLYSILIMSEIVYIFFLTLSTLLLLEAIKRERVLWYAGAGVFFALTILIRPVALLLPLWLLIFILFVLLLQKKPFPKCKYPVIFFILLILTITPWSYYLYGQTGSVLPISSHLPHVIAKSSAIGYDPEQQALTTDTPTTAELAKAKIKNFFYFWDPGAGGYQAELAAESNPIIPTLIILYKTGFFVILSLAFLSLLLYPAPPLFVLWCSILYVWLLHTALYPYPRYMLPVIPFVILLAITTVSNYRAVRTRSRDILHIVTKRNL